MADSEKSIPQEPFHTTILILCICLIGLILLLIFLYKKLNKESEGQYTIRRMVYKEGGVRDRVRGAALALGSAVGVQLWPRSITDEDGEEMQEVRYEEGQVEEGGSQGSYRERDDQEEKEDSVAQCGKTKGQGDDTDDNSSLEGSEAGEKTRLTDEPEAKREAGEKGDEKEEKVGDEEGKGETSGGTGLLLNLKQFSGSAIWSEEEGVAGKDSDITAL